jgi:MFS family permease
MAADPKLTRKLSPVSHDEQSSIAPFYHRAFAILWGATVISNIGTWMQSAAAGWLMTALDPSPFVVSLVQVATLLPMFLFAIPAGALADIVDRRRLMIFIQIVVTVFGFAFAILVRVGQVSPNLLLAFMFLVAAAAALIMPVWQAIVPQLVSPRLLQPAIALNSAGVNVSRAIGPALAGIVIAAWGMDAPFWLNALSNIAVIAALLWWRPPDAKVVHNLPSERFLLAIGAGLRYARYNSYLRATLVRSLGFYVFASAYWALLPLVARNQIAGGPTLYGILLSAIGLGAVGGAVALPSLKRRLGPDRLVAAGTLGTAVALLLFAFARQSGVALTASVLAGVSWIAVLATLNVSAQVALPNWVRGRGLSISGTVMFGSLTLGSALWGQVATLAGLPAALAIAALGALTAIPLLWHWKLQTGPELDLKPSLHWPEPVVALENIESDRGPVLVTVQYEIRPEDKNDFLKAMMELESERRRDGAFSWNIFEDLGQKGRFVETFMLDSWLEHLRQHERVTNADRNLQETADRFQVSGAPKVTHLIAARSDSAETLPLHSATGNTDQA